MDLELAGKTIIVTGASGKGSGLAPSCNAHEDETGVPGQTLRRSYPESFGHPRAEALDQDVGITNQVQDQLVSTRLLEVYTNRSLASIVQVVPGPRGVIT